MSISYEALIPTEAQHRAMAYGQAMEDNERRLGRLAFELCDELVGRVYDGEVISRNQVCAGVALYSGQDLWRIKELEWIEREVPAVWWDAFPELTKNHAKALIPHCEQDLDFVDITARWLDEAHTLSVASLRDWLKPEEEKRKAWQRSYDDLGKLVDRLLGDRHAPEWLKDALRKFRLEEGSRHV